MRRREFITLLGGAAVAWPLAARALQADRVWQIAVLTSGLDNAVARERLVVFQRALEQLGWSEGRNIKLDIRWGANDAGYITSHAKELVQIKPDVILAISTSALIPLRKETRSIPIVFVEVSDPLGQGIVESLARPTGNVTGFSNLEFSLIGKWLQILKEIAPAVSRVGLVISTSNAVSANWFRWFHNMAPSFAIEPIDAPIRDRADIESIIEKLARQPNGGLILPGDTFVIAPATRGLIVGLAASHRLPTLYTDRAFVAEGGLVSYGIDRIDPYRRAASYVDRILKGETPADLPVQQPTKFEFAINLRTAKALGLTVPVTLQASADEVIE